MQQKNWLIAPRAHKVKYLKFFLFFKGIGDNQPQLSIDYWEINVHLGSQRYRYSDVHIMKNVRGISDLSILESFAIALNSLAKPVRYYTKSGEK